MKASVAILIALIGGFFFGGVDLLATLTPWNPLAAQILYYVSINSLVLLLSFLLVYAVGKAFTVMTVLLAMSAFFAMQSLWNMVFGFIAWQTNTLYFPLNLGLGIYANVNQYYLGILFQLLISFILYLSYRVLQ